MEAKMKNRREVDTPAWGWVEVYVEGHDALPEGASMRFKALHEPSPVELVRYESDDGDEGLWRVYAPQSEHDDHGVAAMTCLTDDSGAGRSSLVFGGDWGLRLRQVEGDAIGTVVAEPWLLLAPEDVALVSRSHEAALDEPPSGV